MKMQKYRVGWAQFRTEKQNKKIREKFGLFIVAI